MEQKTMIYEIGAILILISTIPQMIKTYRNRKQLKDISVWWVLLSFFGAGLLAVWALLMEAWMVLALETTWAFYSMFTLIQLLNNLEKV
jgi:uncharacterized protein with PQ loop repeat